MNFLYTLNPSTRSRHLRVTVHPDGAVVVTAPVGYKAAKVEKFLRQKAGWIERTLAKFKKYEGAEFLKGGKREFAAHREEAMRLAQERVERFNKLYGFEYRKIFIRDQRSRWGSCSEARNLAFNFRIVRLPPRLQDYLVVHELCHLKEMNHSQRFWDLVAKAVPDYKRLRRELRTKYILSR